MMKPYSHPEESQQYINVGKKIEWNTEAHHPIQSKYPMKTEGG